MASLAMVRAVAGGVTDAERDHLLARLRRVGARVVAVETRRVGPLAARLVAALVEARRFAVVDRWRGRRGSRRSTAYRRGNVDAPALEEAGVAQALIAHAQGPRALLLEPVQGPQIALRAERPGERRRAADDRLGGRLFEHGADQVVAAAPAAVDQGHGGGVRGAEGGPHGSVGRVGEG